MPKLIQFNTEARRGLEQFDDVHPRVVVVTQVVLGELHRHQVARHGKQVATLHIAPHQLERLEALRDRGTLTDDEFEAQKQRLLGE